MKRLFVLLLACALTSSIFAYGGTHSVSGYTRSDGTYVQEHEAGNPGSDIHCHDNVCQ